jgi:hypothetical protein
MRLTWERVYRRLVQAKDPFVMSGGNAKRSTAFRPLIVCKTLSLSAAAGGSAASSGDTPVDFSSGACILGVSLGVSLGIAAAALTQTHRGLDAVRFSLSYPSGEGLVVTGGPALASALFGIDGSEQFPTDFLLVARGGTMTAVVQNLSTSAVIVDIAAHCMVPR